MRVSSAWPPPATRRAHLRDAASARRHRSHLGEHTAGSSVGGVHVVDVRAATARRPRRARRPHRNRTHLRRRCPRWTGHGPPTSRPPRTWRRPAGLTRRRAPTR